MTPDLSLGGVSLCKEVSGLGTPQQALPSAVSGGDLPWRGQGAPSSLSWESLLQEQIHTLDPCLSLSPLSF